MARGMVADTIAMLKELKAEVDGSECECYTMDDPDSLMMCLKCKLTEFYLLTEEQLKEFEK